MPLRGDDPYHQPSRNDPDATAKYLDIEHPLVARPRGPIGATTLTLNADGTDVLLLAAYGVTANILYYNQPNASLL